MLSDVAEGYASPVTLLPLENGTGQHEIVTRIQHAGVPLYEEIAHAARQYLDMQKIRIGMANRDRQFRETQAEKGRTGLAVFAMEAATGHSKRSAAQLAQYAEEKIGKVIQDLVSDHPLAPWVESAPGFGLLGFGLLLGALGRPLDAFPNPAKVWKFLGLDVRPDGRAPRRERGVKFVKTTPDEKGTAYSPEGRTICYRIGDAIVKHGKGQYRALYDTKKSEYQAREKTGPSQCSFGHTHKNKAGQIIACGAGHVHAAAQRYAVKRLIRDLWNEWQRLRP